MTAFALALLLCAGFVHAGWNFLAKKAGGGPVFVWLFALISSLVYAPMAAVAVAWVKPHIGLLEAGVMLGTALIHIAYFLLLQQGYRVGDLSDLGKTADRRLSLDCSPARSSPCTPSGTSLPLAPI